MVITIKVTRDEIKAMVSDALKTKTGLNVDFDVRLEAYGDSTACAEFPEAPTELIAAAPAGKGSTALPRASAIFKDLLDELEDSNV